LDRPYSSPVSFKLRTRDGTAVNGVDYTAPAFINLNFPPGVTDEYLYVSIVIRGDLIPEDDELFYLEVFDPINGLIPTSWTTVTILNDD
jgi:hypothetical protein